MVTPSCQPMMTVPVVVSALNSVLFRPRVTPSPILTTPASCDGLNVISPSPEAIEVPFSSSKS